MDEEDKEVNIKQWFNMDHDEKNSQLLSSQEIIKGIKDIENKSDAEQADGKEEMFNPTSHETALTYVEHLFVCL